MHGGDDARQLVCWQIVACDVCGNHPHRHPDQISFDNLAHLNALSAANSGLARQGATSVRLVNSWLAAMCVPERVRPFSAFRSDFAKAQQQSGSSCAPRTRSVYEIRGSCESESALPTRILRKVLREITFRGRLGAAERGLRPPSGACGQPSRSGVRNQKVAASQMDSREGGPYWVDMRPGRLWRPSKSFDASPPIGQVGAFRSSTPPAAQSFLRIMLGRPSFRGRRMDQVPMLPHAMIGIESR